MSNVTQDFDYLEARKKVRCTEWVEDVRTVEEMAERMLNQFSTKDVVFFLMNEFEMKESEAYAFLGKYNEWEDKYDL